MKASTYLEHGKFALLAKRQTWGELNPVTRKPENSKAYNRNKARNWKSDYHETSSGTFYLHARLSLAGSWSM